MMLKRFFFNGRIFNENSCNFPPFPILSYIVNDGWKKNKQRERAGIACCVCFSPISYSLSLNTPLDITHTFANWNLTMLTH